MLIEIITGSIVKLIVSGATFFWRKTTKKKKQIHLTVSSAIRKEPKRESYFSPANQRKRERRQFKFFSDLNRKSY